ncbi:hypothetical protein AJ80_00225 [Polytolypa hystricis UAMH7299]|uniref:Uncharacterized protein n=1 Tax=Polytolypa hystricis (strain UAMH7299) TaxID=1447883 RepID=A0A2B7Z3N5_POLH7|nr:hypothetical protein AJ80_00225 [Polytolypa hystricis UAMH7299]
MAPFFSTPVSSSSPASSTRPTHLHVPAKSQRRKSHRSSSWSAWGTGPLQRVKEHHEYRSSSLGREVSRTHGGAEEVGSGGGGSGSFARLASPIRWGRRRGDSKKPVAFDDQIAASASGDVPSADGTVRRGRSPRRDPIFGHDDGSDGHDGNVHNKPSKESSRPRNKADSTHWLALRRRLEEEAEVTQRRDSRHKRGRRAKRDKMPRPRTVSCEDYLTARGANPRTGVVSPSILSGINTSDHQGSREEELTKRVPSQKWRLKGDQWISLDTEQKTPLPTPPVDESRKQSPLNPQIVVKGGSHPNPPSPLSALNIPLHELQDRFVVNMPSAKEPCPITMTTQQIIDYQQAIARLYREGGDMVDPNTAPTPRSVTPEGKSTPPRKLEKTRPMFKAWRKRQFPESDGKPPKKRPFRERGHGDANNEGGSPPGNTKSRHGQSPSGHFVEREPGNANPPVGRTAYPASNNETQMPFLGQREGDGGLGPPNGAPESPIVSSPSPSRPWTKLPMHLNSPLKPVIEEGDEVPQMDRCLPLQTDRNSGDAMIPLTIDQLVGRPSALQLPDQTDMDHPYPETPEENPLTTTTTTTTTSTPTTTTSSIPHTPPILNGSQQTPLFCPGGEQRSFPAAQARINDTAASPGGQNIQNDLSTGMATQGPTATSYTPKTGSRGCIRIAGTRRGEDQVRWVDSSSFAGCECVGCMEGNVRSWGSESNTLGNDSDGGLRNTVHEDIDHQDDGLRCLDFQEGGEELKGATMPGQSTVPGPLPESQLPKMNGPSNNMEAVWDLTSFPSHISSNPRPRHPFIYLQLILHALFSLFIHGLDVTLRLCKFWFPKHPRQRRKGNTIHFDTHILLLSGGNQESTVKLATLVFQVLVAWTCYVAVTHVLALLAKGVTWFIVWGTWSVWIAGVVGLMMSSALQVGGLG